MYSPAAATASLERRGRSTPDAGGLFATYSAQILAYCQHSLGSRSDAEDALQTTFLQAHRALQRGAVPECESAWLTTIAKNVCRWQRRTLSRRGPIVDTPIDVNTLPARADDERQDALADLKHALEGIPERQRLALVLREWQGLQPREIAPRLGASTSETYALLARARRSVASTLTSGAGRPVLGIDFGSLVLQLRSLLAGSPAAVCATAVAIAGLGVAGVTVERAVDHPSASGAPALVSHARQSSARVERATRGAETPMRPLVARPSRVRPASSVTAVRPTRTRAGRGEGSAPIAAVPASHADGPRSTAHETSAPTAASAPGSAPTDSPKVTTSTSLPLAAPSVPDPGAPLPAEPPAVPTSTPSHLTGQSPADDSSDAGAPAVPPLPTLPGPVEGLLP